MNTKGEEKNTYRRHWRLEEPIGTPTPRVSVLCELLREDLVELGVEDTINDEPVNRYAQTSKT